MKLLQILPRENKQNLNPPSPKKQPSPNIVDITDEMDQSSRDAQKANTTKTTNSATINDPKKNPADSKSSNPKSSAENSRFDKASANTQTVPEKQSKIAEIRELKQKIKGNLKLKVKLLKLKKNHSKQQFQKMK